MNTGRTLAPPTQLDWKGLRMEGSSALSVAFAPGVTVTKWARVWAERHPEIPLNLIPTSQLHQVEVVLDGTAQLSFVRLPIESQGLHVIPLYRERAVAVAAKDHLIAAANSVTLSDIAGEAQHSASPEHGDRGAFDLVAAGVGVLVVPQSLARAQSRKDVVVRPISDAPETQIALVWHAVESGEHAEWIEDFIGIVRGRTAHSSRSATPDEASPKEQQAAKQQRAKKGSAKSTGRAQRGSSSQSSGAAHARSRKNAQARKKHRGR